MSPPPRILGRDHVRLYEAWTLDEVRGAVQDLLAAFPRPPDRGARVLIKPNLNNDLSALIGNSADLRVLAALAEALSDLGYTDLTFADGPNVGMARRGLDNFRRLRVDRLARRHGVKILDLNHVEGIPVALHAGARPRVARAVIEAEWLISVPKIKTHAEAVLSCAMKNWVGICVGQDKREMHHDLGRNILALNEAVRPHLVVVDGLVGMEGNGPGDGHPKRLGRVLGSDDAMINDLVVARLVGIPADAVPYLAHAAEAGYLPADLRAEVDEALPQPLPFTPAPPRSALARLSEARSLGWLKRASRPLIERPAVAEAAYRLRVIQDVYDREDDTITRVRRLHDDCAGCRRCEEVCPTGLKVEEIGVRVAEEDCVQCLYCWWVCPRQAIGLDGEPGFLERHARQHKAAVEAL